MRARSHSSATAVFSLVVLALFAVSGGFLACDSGGTECVCPSTGLTVSLPSALIGGVTAIQLSGLACADGGVSPDPVPESPAQTFHITPTQPGQCQIDILLADGTTVSDNLTVVETTGCCAGLRTSPTGAAEIDVPAPEDAGE